MIFNPGIMGARGDIKSTRIFYTDFTDTALSGYQTNGTSAFNYVTGNNNGYTWPYSGGTNQILDSIKTNIQLINNYINVTTANNSSYGTAAINPVVDLPGYTGNSLDLAVLDTGLINNGINVAFGGQNDFIFARIENDSVLPTHDLVDLYCKYYFKLPASLGDAILASSGIGRALIFNVKSGGYTPSGGTVRYGGDFRFNVGIQKNGAAHQWVTHADRNANGTMTSGPDLSVAWDTQSDFWIETSGAVAPRFDQWMKFEIYWHRHETAGVCKVAIDDVVVCNQANVRTTGEYNLPIGRLMVFLCYSGAGSGSTIGLCSGKVCDIDIRNFPPSGSVLLPI